MNNNSRPANTFQIGSFISIDGVIGMKKLRIDYISDGCVTVYGKDSEDGTDHVFTISGSSPAIPYTTESRVNGDTGEVTFEPTKERAKRGSYAEILKDPKIPSGKFSIGEFADLNGVPYQYAFNWVKDNCVSRGFREKEEGKRGKAPEVFEKIF